jgi:hypothetical protein
MQTNLVFAEDLQPGDTIFHRGYAATVMFNTPAAEVGQRFLCWGEWDGECCVLPNRFLVVVAPPVPTMPDFSAACTAVSPDPSTPPACPPG